MYLIETIKILDRKIYNLDRHQKRLMASFKKVFGYTPDIQLKKAINVYKVPEKGLYKCRVVYDEKIKEITFQPYQKRRISSLKIVHNDKIEYSLKYENRTALNLLKAKYPKYDEILIIKNKEVTDTTYTNVVCYDGKDYYTPASPLLKGTKRGELLEKGIIQKAIILEKDLARFQSIYLINAMMELGECEVILIHI